jgi:hypothetical protein
MNGRAKRPNLRSGAALAASAIALAIAGCGGGEDFKRETKAPIPVDLTGSIQEDKVTVSPDQVGAGPIEITISNQTHEAHTVTLEGERVRERVGPINPEDTATLQKTLAPGTYEVRAGSSVAAPREIAPALLEVGPKRKDSGSDVLQP